MIIEHSPSEQLNKQMAVLLLIVICATFTGFIEGNDVVSPDEPTMAGHTSVNINESVSNILITSSKTDLVEFNSSVTLVCSASGSPTSFLWFNGSSEVTANDRVHFTDGGSNLTIINVTRFDQGPFRCLVSNLLSNGTSDPVKLSISYGPENIKLRVNPSKEYYKVGSDIFFSCKADSKPPARYHWLVNGALGFTGGIGFGVIDARTSQSGNYSCQAFNSRTLRYETSQPLSITIVAIDSVESSECLISGIVITCCVIVAAAVGGGYYIYKRNRRHLNQSTHTETTTATAEGQDNPASSSQELNFTNVRFIPNKNTHSDSAHYASSPPSYDDVMQEVNRFK
ncbi:carcinoembryonic antigen-related cell adhesion molecule 1-like isoform X2 [Oreochromis aureus]|uniref:carcinoembryonic antigen-related cell adhesion molecule 1-like isoform X2 n=1 Tax=Oreochromis aureus TaxID=47969 RepID=UPI001952CD04|nr:carcinoembryonic antigen-related cell adhesion molecule 1-like isoform X2 [Oreochromis aureus]